MGSMFSDEPKAEIPQVKSPQVDVPKCTYAIKRYDVMFSYKFGTEEWKLVRLVYDKKTKATTEIIMRKYRATFRYGESAKWEFDNHHRFIWVDPFVDVIFNDMRLQMGPINKFELWIMFRILYVYLVGDVRRKIIANITNLPRLTSQKISETIALGLPYV